MSVFHNNALIGASGQAAGGAYEIERSLRFNSADSAYLSRTPASAGNRKTWTWAGWVKRSRTAHTDLDCFFACLITASNYVQLAFTSTDRLGIYLANATAVSQNFSNAAYRDLSAWYHIHVALDSTQTVAADRLRVYVNGSEITYFTDDRADIGKDTDFSVNSTSGHAISSIVPYASSRYFSGYLADIHFIDGQALDPTSFGEFDDNGIWQPIAYSGSYGTNGFHLDFADNSTAAALGTDTSGNSNTWTVNNISVAAGAGNDSLVDVPVNGTEEDTGVGGEVRGNYCTWNPLDGNYYATAGANGNLEAVMTGGYSYYGTMRATMAASFKAYWETTVASVRSYQYHGIAYGSLLARQSGASHIVGYTSVPDSISIYAENGTIRKNSSGIKTTEFTIAAGDIFMHAYDPDTGKYWIGHQGTWLYSGDPATGANPITTLDNTKAWFPAVSDAADQKIVGNFGQRQFSYSAPSGFKALCTANMPAGAVITSGTFAGSAVVDGPFVYLNGVPTAMTINGNAVTFGTHADKLSNGFKIRTNSSLYNTSSNTYSVTTTGDTFKDARAQSNP